MAEVIAVWSEIDHEMGGIFGAALGADAELGIELYVAIQNNAPRKAVMIAGLRARLDKAKANKVEEFVRDLKKPREKRDKIAHGLWGTSPNHPDCLVWADTRLSMRQKALPERAEVTMADYLANRPYDHIPKLQLYDSEEFDAITDEAGDLYRRSLGLQLEILKRHSREQPESSQPDQSAPTHSDQNSSLPPPKQADQNVRPKRKPRP
jgi:hypothetical protein